MSDLSTYAESGIQLALTVVAISLFLMVEFSYPSTFIYALGIPALFGYTIITSKEDFNKASLASSIGLVFIPLGGLVAAISILIFVGNVLISFFASGNNFQNYYSSTMLPFLLIGILMGSTIAAYAIHNPGFESSLQNKTVEIGADQTVKLMEITDMNQDQEAVKEMTRSTVVSTEAYVVDSYSNDARNPDMAALQEAFDGAKEDIPADISSQIDEQDGSDIRDEVEDTIRGLVSDRMPFIAFFFLIMLFYGLQPVLGLLTAVFASLFEGLNSRIE